MKQEVVDASESKSGSTLDPTVGLLGATDEPVPRCEPVGGGVGPRRGGLLEFRQLFEHGISGGDGGMATIAPGLGRAVQCLVKQGIDHPPMGLGQTHEVVGGRVLPRIARCKHGHRHVEVVFLQIEHSPRISAQLGQRFGVRRVVEHHGSI